MKRGSSALRSVPVAETRPVLAAGSRSVVPESEQSMVSRLRQVVQDPLVVALGIATLVLAAWPLLSNTWSPGVGWLLVSLLLWGLFLYRVMARLRSVL